MHDELKFKIYNKISKKCFKVTRIDYIEKHLRACKEAITDGVDLIGYCTWSFTDLLSWLNGYQKRYGFVYVDRDEQDEKEMARYKKKSFYWYKDVIMNNGKDI